MAGIDYTREQTRREELSFIKVPAFDSIRVFETGATRSPAEGKPDFEGYLSPLVIERYGEYMLRHAKQTDGTMRPSDNWQRGIPLSEYLKSAYRHFMDWWMIERGHVGRETLEDSLCALIFNASGYLHEVLKKRKFREGE